MKKILAIVMCMAMFAFVVGCAKDEAGTAGAGNDEGCCGTCGGDKDPATDTEKVKDAVEDAKDKVEGTVEDAKEKVEDMVEEVKETTEEKVEETKKALEGVKIPE
ncbi:MAG: hypothetical protein JEZ07_05715 [Phycisphaerae bacterium]|nr:hypothetical protein [Phycisphaerae bacterium]